MSGEAGDRVGPPAGGAPEGKLRLGGMALGNGLLVHGPTAWAAAVRGRDGSIGVASGRKPRLQGRLADAPGVRGVARLAEALVVVPLVKRALPEARLPFEDPRVLGSAVAVSVGGAALRRRHGGAAGDAAIAALSVLPSLVALRGGQTAAYHGVEHKAIAAYEQDRADARGAAKEHDRCGSHLLAPMLVANVAGAALLRAVVASPSRLAGAAVQLGATGVAVEVFAWAERHRGTRLERALRRPGHELQRAVGTREPTDEQLDVGRAALAEILRAERGA
jgi:uncharacterized protein YqhQ